MAIVSSGRMYIHDNDDNGQRRIELGNQATHWIAREDEVPTSNIGINLQLNDGEDTPEEDLPVLSVRNGGVYVDGYHITELESDLTAITTEHEVVEEEDTPALTEELPPIDATRLGREILASIDADFHRRRMQEIWAPTPSEPSLEADMRQAEIDEARVAVEQSQEELAQVETQARRAEAEGEVNPEILARLEAVNARHEEFLARLRAAEEAVTVDTPPAVNETPERPAVTVNLNGVELPNLRIDAEGSAHITGARIAQDSIARTNVEDWVVREPRLRPGAPFTVAGSGITTSTFRMPKKVKLDADKINNTMDMVKVMRALLRQAEFDERVIEEFELQEYVQAPKPSTPPRTDSIQVGGTNDAPVRRGSFSWDSTSIGNIEAGDIRGETIQSGAIQVGRIQQL